MSDNEKRAHDLAIVAMNYQKSDVDKGETEKFDIYQSYKSLYEKMVELFNRDCPDGK